MHALIKGLRYKLEMVLCGIVQCCAHSDCPFGNLMVQISCPPYKHSSRLLLSKIWTVRLPTDSPNVHIVVHNTVPQAPPWCSCTPISLNFEQFVSKRSGKILLFIEFYFAIFSPLSSKTKQRNGIFLKLSLLFHSFSHVSNKTLQKGNLKKTHLSLHLNVS